MTLIIRRVTACGVVAALTLTLLATVATPSAATVDVGDDLHGVYDGCIAKFTAAGKRDLVDQLDKSSNVFKFRKSAGTMTNPDWWSGNDATNGKGTGGTTRWNPDDTSPLPGGHIRDTCATLYHEMSHLADYDKGTNQDYPCQYMEGGVKKSAGTSAAEVKATRKENEYRATQSTLDKDPRKTYNGVDPLPPAGTDCLPRPPPPPSRGCSVGCAIGAGDPHLRTYDEVYYDLQAVGEFVLSRASAGDLEIQGRQSPMAGLRTVSLYTAVAANVAGDRVGVYRLPDAIQVRVGGTVAPPSTGPSPLPRGGAVEAYGDGSVDVRWPDGSVVHARLSGAGSLSLSVHLAEARRGTVQGLFGNFDGKAEGDLVVRGGAAIPQQPAYADLYPKYADSWRVAQADSLFDYGPGQNTDTFTDRSFPDRSVTAADLPNRGTAEAICRQAGVTEPTALRGCVLDVGLTGDVSFAADAMATQRLVATAGATTLTVANPGGTATLTFPGTASQRIFVDVLSSDLPDQCGVLTLLGPAGESVGGGCVIGGRGFVDGTVLPATGTYTLLLDPAGTSTGRVNLRLVTDTDTEGRITRDGPEVAVTIGQPGAVARLRFTAAAGTKVFLDVLSATLPDQCGLLTLLDPGGKFVGGGCVIGGRGFVDGSVLPAAGEYTILVDPADWKVGTARLRLVVDVDQSGTIAVNGPAVTATVSQAGAVSRFQFTGTAGQAVSLDVSASTLPDLCGVLTLLDPAGRFVAGGCVIGGKGGINPVGLPVNGLYTILVDPAERATGTSQLRLRT